MISCRECGVSYSTSVHKQCPECGAPVPYVCSKCNKPLETWTSVCECKGWAVENEDKSENDEIVEYKRQKLEWFKKFSVVLILIEIILFISMCVLLVCTSDESWLFVFAFLMFVTSGIYILIGISY